MASLQGEAAAWAADLYSDQARELADIGLFLDALKTRFEDPTRLQQAEAQLLGLRQRGRPVHDYIREFQKVAGRLRSWPDRLLIHHIRAGLDTDIRRACVVRGIVGRLSDWFKAAVELDVGLRDCPGAHEEWPQSRRNQDQPGGSANQVPPSTVRPKPVFRCFHCNRPGHRAAECVVPEPTGTPMAVGRPGATPKKMMEK
ncbi:RTL1: Retrotransposon-like 1 [Crotalus adamanteus]|uniref:RTL1: Retrotransposon-like 1 n=1 Tax=Crotalus adamanteus TaxID=8729 RepID=A0AAW1C282_CROAD